MSNIVVTCDNVPEISKQITLTHLVLKGRQRAVEILLAVALGRDERLGGRLLRVLELLAQARDDLGELEVHGHARVALLGELEDHLPAVVLHLAQPQLALTQAGGRALVLLRARAEDLVDADDELRPRVRELGQVQRHARRRHPTQRVPRRLVVLRDTRKQH